MRQIKGFICGIVFAVGLMAIPTVADTVEKTITVLTDYVTVQVDGETKDVRNFVHEGTTYIALRDVSEVFGYEVGWDDETHVASISTGKEAVNNATAIDVNGTIVTAAEFKEMYDMLSSYYQYYGTGVSQDELIEYAKNELATQAIVNQKAKEFNVADSDKLREDAEAELSALEMAYGSDTVDQLLSYQGYSSRSEYVRMAVIQQINSGLFTYLENNYAEYKAVADGAEAYYNEHKEDYKSPSVQVKHILIPTVNLETGEAFSEGEAAVAKALAEDVAKKATPENFDELIAEHNQDSGQTEEGYAVSADSNFVEEFKAAALALTEVGQITEPVLSSYGYHIIMATEFNEYLPYETFLTNYLNEKYNELDQQIIQQWLQEANIVFNDEVINSIL